MVVVLAPTAVVSFLADFSSAEKIQAHGGNRDKKAAWPFAQKINTNQLCHNQSYF